MWMRGGGGGGSHRLFEFERLLRGGEVVVGGGGMRELAFNNARLPRIAAQTAAVPCEHRRRFFLDGAKSNLTPTSLRSVCGVGRQLCWNLSYWRRREQAVGAGGGKNGISGCNT